MVIGMINHNIIACIRVVDFFYFSVKIKEKI